MSLLTTGEALKQLARNALLAKLRNLLASRPALDLYLAGGAVRDAFLDRPAPDLDIVCSPHDVQPLGVFLSKAWPCRLIVLNERWGMVRLVPVSPEGAGRGALDLAPARGGRIEEDLLLRDFTVNAMAVRIPRDPGKPLEEFLDPAGGARDLALGKIRMVHPDCLFEDPVRLLRAFRIACGLGFAVEAGTLEAIRQAAPRLLLTAPERIRDELFKLLARPRSQPYLDAMDRAGLVPVLFPETVALRGLEQGPEHPLEAWAHSMEAFRKVEEMIEEGFPVLEPWGAVLSDWVAQEEGRAALLKLAALLHDTGKPRTALSGPDGRVHFFGHDREGARICRSIAARLRLSRRSGFSLERWVRFHLWPLHLYRSACAGKLGDRAKMRFFKRLGSDAPGTLLLSAADQEAKKKHLDQRDSSRNFMDFLKSMIQFSVERDPAGVRQPPLITGREIMDRFGLSAGPRIGRLLDKVHEARVAGEIATPGEALDLVGRMLGKGIT